MFAAASAKELGLLLKVATGAEEDAIAYLNAVKLVAPLRENRERVLRLAPNGARLAESFALDSAPESEVGLEERLGNECRAIAFELEPNHRRPNLQALHIGARTIEDTASRCCRIEVLLSL